MQRPRVTNEIRVLVIGLGVIGREAASAIATRKGMKIVGAVDNNPALVGRDLGEILGLPGASGVTVASKLEEAIALCDAHIAGHFANTLLEEAWVQLEPLFNAKIDVVSSNEELGNPFATKRELANKINRIAIDRGVSVLGSGFSPGFTPDSLILALTAGCRDVSRIHYRRVGDVRQYVEGTVGVHYGLGLNPSDFAAGVASGTIIGHIGFVEAAITLATKLGWDYEKLERSVEARYDSQGKFVSTDTVVRGFVDGKERLLLEMVASIAENDPDRGDTWEIEANPPIRVVAQPLTRSVPITANAVVNAIPYVLNAKAGLLTPGDMPLIHAVDGDATLLLS